MEERIVLAGELGVVIRSQCQNVPRSDADSAIAGYTCVNDVTNGGGDWVRIKNLALVNSHIAAGFTV